MTNSLFPMTCVLIAPFLLGQVAGDTGGGVTANASESVNVHSVWDFVVKGGPVMIPIGLCSLIALTVVVERLISLRRSVVIPHDFVSGLTGLLDNGNAESDRKKALDHCQKSSSPLAAILAAGIKRLGQPAEVLEKNVQEAGQREVVKLRKYLRLLSVIASIAPLLGLLGTIFGMITAFQTVAASGEALGKTELLAKGIYEAMITTAAGLMVAIPVIIAYHGISAKVESLVADMDRLVVEFIDCLSARSVAPAGTVVHRSVGMMDRTESDEVKDPTDGKMSAVAVVETP